VVVFVLNKYGKPLMPCKPAKARHLLKKGKARVISINPFAIQLLYGSGGAVQLITLGVDPGYDKTGFSVTTDAKELMSGEVQLRKDVSKKLSERRTYRRNRRSRLWHREPRFNNRVASKKKSWLAPSIKHRLDAHINLVEKIKNLLPISEVIVEVASFDTQKMMNPEISGVEYQRGELQGYEVKEYLLEKWGRRCAYCGKKNVGLETEHIVSKSRGGTDRVSNLTIACRECNLKKDSMTAEEFGYPDIQKRANQSLKEAAFMNSIRWRIVNVLNCKWTYGYITKYNRKKLGLDKSHINDAFIIASGSKQNRVASYNVRRWRRNNRKLQLNRKGFKPAIRRQRYKLQPHDWVKYFGQVVPIKGVHCLGKYVLLENNKSVSVNKISLHKYGKSWQFLPRVNSGVSLPRFE